MRIRGRYLIYGLVGAMAIGVAIPLVTEASRPDGAIWHAATFLGSILVTIGWVVTSETTIRNSKRQHTIAFITSHVGDGARLSNRKIIKAHLKTHTTKLISSMATGNSFDQEDDPLLEAIDAELNYYEFAAAGIIGDDLDEELLRKCLRGNFCSFYQQTEDYINHWRNKRSATWEHLARMYGRWK